MKKQAYINTLIILQSFENFWTFCQLTDGELYIKECKEITLKLVQRLKDVYKIDKQIFSSKSLRIDRNDTNNYIEKVINELEVWASSDRNLPYSREFERSWHISLHFVMSLKAYLLKKVAPDIEIPITWSSEQMDFSKSRIRWNAHLPRHILLEIPENFEKELSQSNTITVVADIRKSQDLMTYSPSAEYFREMMIEFIQTSRKIIKDNYGIFDKFTGDGFLAYFNEDVCAKANKNYIDCFIKSSKEILDFSNEHFSRWTKSIRKLPLGSSGLTLGADIGKIEYKEIEGHLFAIGDTIVWANRVCSAGKSNEIILNNILYNIIKDYDKKINFESIDSITKAGESFTAYKMKI
ncbi:MAG TPA: adenylate/guanylate cyclase domain-containing protein [Patescibacteria group bacterium]|nr:adenylate/guanylate cyclase domain-containing protein [Patescibacteria group bacterium]